MTSTKPTPWTKPWTTCRWRCKRMSLQNRALQKPIKRSILGYKNLTIFMGRRRKASESLSVEELQRIFCEHFPVVHFKGKFGVEKPDKGAGLNQVGAGKGYARRRFQGVFHHKGNLLPRWRGRRSTDSKQEKNNNPSTAKDFMVEKLKKWEERIAEEDCD